MILRTIQPRFKEDRVKRIIMVDDLDKADKILELVKPNTPPGVSLPLLLAGIGIFGQGKHINPKPKKELTESAMAAIRNAEERRARKRAKRLADFKKMGRD